MSDPYVIRRRQSVQDHIASRGVRNEAVLAAMRTVPRHLFVPDDLVEHAYEDRPLPIGFEQTISQPYIVAAMSEALEIGAGDRVLEVGTGSGYQAAVLAELVSEVYTVEVVPQLVESARERLARYHYRNVFVHAGDGSLGLPSQAPFDGILVACGAEKVPPALVDQLADGRRMIIPIGPPGGLMQLTLVIKQGTGVEHREIMPVRFVPLLTG
jgi:protein-L-isoaspartate(D-aspartate) O-methyltransferase